jgi:tetratricopeptide (TPR) repeat protein
MTTVVDDAKVLVARGRLDEALSALDALLGDDPRNVDALLLKAAVVFERRGEDEAIALCRAAVDADSQSAEAHNTLARCLHAVGRHEEALACAETARAILTVGDNFRHAASVYLTLVWCLRDLRRLREAVAAAEEGLLRCPDAILAQWATVVEEELEEAEQERC